jgi:hypothetical protein
MYKFTIGRMELNEIGTMLVLYQFSLPKRYNFPVSL